MPRNSAQGKRFISTKWVVVRKGDGSVRARYVCREFKSGKKGGGLFAPSTTTITTRVIDVMACKKRLGTMTGDTPMLYSMHQRTRRSTTNRRASGVRRIPRWLTWSGEA